MSTKMRSAIEGRFAKISVVTGLSTALSMGLQLVSVPVCMRYWGNDTYGAWLALFAAFTLMRTFDGGYIGYVGNKLNMLYHQDERALRVTLASAMWGVAVLVGIQLLLLTLLYATASIGLIMGSQNSLAAMREAMLALLVLIGSWIFTGSYLGILHRFMIPTGLMYQAAWWSIGFQVAQFSVIIAAAVFGFRLPQAALLFALVQTVMYTGSAVYIRLKLPCYYPWWTNPIRAVGIGDLLRSLPFTFSGVLQAGGNNGLVVLISSLLGPTAVPTFATVRTLNNLWTTLINVLTAPLLPDMVRFRVSGEGLKLVAVHQVHWLLVGSAVNLSILLAYPFFESVYGIWTQNLLPLDKPLLALLLAAGSLTGMSAPMSTLLSGINHAGFTITSAALRGGLTLLLGMLLLPAYRTTGLGVAIFLGEAFALAVTVRWFRLELAQIGGGAISTPLTWALVSSGCVAAYLVIESFGLAFSNGVYWVALTCVVFGGVFPWLGLDADIKTRIRAMLHPLGGISALG